MEEHRPRRARAADENRARRAAPTANRPDRIALWAVVMGIVAMLAGAASAQGGSSGGAGPDGASAQTASCPDVRLGARSLRLGDCGDDVRTLNWLLKAKRLSPSPSPAKSFQKPTDQGVRELERRAGLEVDGVFERRTHRALVRSMPRQRATWYGPGFWGNRTACGQRLRRATVGVAHKRLPCGSRVVVRYKGRFLRTRVIDRGPYAHGAKWDLTRKAARKLRFTYTDDVRVAKIPKR